MRLRLLFAAFLLLPSLLLAEERIVVQANHNDTVTALAVHPLSNRLVSAAADGTIKVWDNQRILYTRQVSHLGLSRLAVHPTEPICAYVATDNINTYRLGLFNWRENTELYSIRLEEQPLDIGFSPQGTFLYYSVTDYRSFNLLDAKAGARKKLAESGYGIVSSSFISGSEKTLVSYLPSGNIVYWDLEQDQRKAAPIGTASNLELISFSADRLFGLGYRGDFLYLFDLVSGATLSRLEVDGIAEIVTHPSQREATLIRSTGRQQEILTVDFSSSRRQLRISDRSTLRGIRPSALTYRQNRIISGMDDGSLGYFSAANGFRRWISGNPASLSDIDIWNGSLALSGPGQIQLFDAPELVSSNPESPERLNRTTVSLPFDDNGGFLPLDSRSGVVWNGDKADKAYLFSVSSGSFEELFPVEAGTEEIYTDGERLLSLDRNGRINIYNLEERELQYQYAASGIRDATFIDEDTIIAGRNPSARFPSPLMRINLRTGETVPLTASELLTFAIRYEPLTGSLYTLGLQERQGRIVTVLRELQGSDFQRSRALLSFPGEDRSSAFVLEDLRLYTSIGSSGLLVSGWQGFSNLEQVESIPRKISSERGLVASLNNDGSASIWNSRTGRHLGTLFLFEDDEWLFLSDKGYQSSPGARSHYAVFENEEIRY